MRQYETIFIVNPNLSDDDYGQVLSKYKDLIEKKNGVIVKVEEWGKQRMAYVVRKFDRGSYVLINYCSDQKEIADIELALKLDEQIILYQTVKLDDNAKVEELVPKEQPAEEKEEEAEESENKESETSEEPENTKSEDEGK